MSKKYIADTLRKYREQSGITVKEVADRFGKSVKTIYSWESGQGQPDASTLIELCFWYGIDSFEALSENKEIKSQPLCNIDCTHKEKEIIKAYRNKPEMQGAVDRLLGIEECSEEFHEKHA